PRRVHRGARGPLRRQIEAGNMTTWHRPNLAPLRSWWAPPRADHRAARDGVPPTGRTHLTPESLD
ncbi:hypothetical protein ACWC5I_16150, partial [Kitasatospora sp. NPDC001574]